MMRLILSLLTLFLFLPFPALAASYSSETRSERAIVSLESEATHITAGKKFWLRLHFNLADDWHIYWKNPGDSGLPANLNWQLPSGFNAEDIKWPAPAPILIEGLMNYGYHDDVSLLIPIIAPENLPLGEDLNLKLKANWLICKETCIPESGEFEIEVSSAEEMRAASNASLIVEEVRNLPIESPVKGLLQDSQQEITLEWPTEIENTSDVYFFAEIQGVLDHAAPQLWEIKSGSLSATLKKGTEKIPETLTGILKQGETAYRITFYKDPNSITQNPSTATIYADEVETIPAPSTNKEQINTPSTSLVAAIFFALLGGLLLNAMPCVFPVLSLKALAISKKAEAESSAVQKQGIAYLFGTISTFSLLALMLITLKNAGYAAGWGFQLQSPVFVGVMLCLFIIIGLGLIGLFEFPQFFGNLGQEKAGKDSLSGSFFTGVLAVLVATPCTVPFMAPALSYAFTQSATITFMIMLMMGLGMALPYLFISFFPAARRLLPKPGLWMERFKQLMAFPMFATAAWLLWVITQQIDLTSLAIMLAIIVFVPFAIWLAKGKSYFTSLIIFLMAAAATGYGLAQLEAKAAQTMLAEDHIAYDEQELLKLRKEGRAVFLDATAAWCITCKVNENGALSSSSTKALFNENQIITMVADWTNYDPSITSLLESFDHQGVPLYVYYPPQEGEPKVLPQLLTESILQDAITQ